MKIKIIAVGKLKEKYLKEGISEYVKRLGRFTKVEIIELIDEKTPDQASENQKIQILEKEGKRILSRVSERDYVICLAIEGQQFPSDEFSRYIEKQKIQGVSDFTFIIGGSLGLANSVKKRANILMSFGLLTLPHQLMRLVLLEQVYRSFMIQEGSPYHK